MQVIDQPESFNLLNTLLFNIPSNPSCCSHGLDLADLIITRSNCFQVYIVSFSLGFGPIPWLLMGELLPSRARGPCAAFATGSQKPPLNYTLTGIMPSLQFHFSIPGPIGLQLSWWRRLSSCSAPPSAPQPSSGFTLFSVPPVSSLSLLPSQRLVAGGKYHLFPFCHFFLLLNSYVNFILYICIFTTQKS